MSTSVIPVPTDEKAFERQCRVLFAELLGDPHVKLVATKGKNQGGLDLMGTRQRDPHQPVGIQCKLITKVGGKLDLVGVRSDITRALTLSPPLTCLPRWPVPLRSTSASLGIFIPAAAR